MEQWRLPVTIEDQNELTAGMDAALAQYYEKRNTPGPSTPPKIDLQPRPFPVQTAVKVGVAISGTAIAAVSVVSVGKAIAVGVAAFAAANAFTIGAVTIGGVVVGIVWAMAANGEHGANVRTKTGNTESEQQQTIININVAAGSGRVEVNR